MESAESWAKGQGLSIWRGSRNWLNTALDALLPQRCLLCAQASGHEPVCPGCLARLPHLPAPACIVCAHPHEALAFGSAGLPCGRCLAQPPAYDATLAVYAYLHPVDELVRVLKYGRRLASADFLSRALAGLLSHVGIPVDCVLPMPLSPTRLAERGFNQALELARPVARQVGLPLEVAALTRRNDPTHQASLPWTARASSMHGAFACHADFSGQHVLVIDDVMTTGATLNELARVLKAHGAARVTNLVVARTLRQ